MKFNEQKIVEEYILKFMQDKLGYEYIPPKEFAKLRQYEHEFIIEPLLLEAVKRINNVDDAKAQEVVREVQKADDNEEFLGLLRAGVDVKDRETGKTKRYKLVDYENIAKNQFVITNQIYFEGTVENIIPDILVFLNGIPVIDIEAKGPDVNYEEAIGQIKRYERNASKLYLPNCFNIATDGFKTVYAATYAPKGYFFEWKDQPSPLPSPSKGEGTLEDPELEITLNALCAPEQLLDIIKNFIVFEYDSDSKEKVKKIARYQQIRAANKIVNRVRERDSQFGLIWHTQGSGKSLTMYFTAWKLRFAPELDNPKVFVLVDRVDLDDQLFEVFLNSGGKNIIRVTSQEDLRKKLTSSEKGIFISTVQKFEEVGKVQNPAENIIVLVDEAHRSQEGIQGIQLRNALPNAYFFGFSGTPIDKATLNTHRAFGEKGERYLDYYSIKQAIDDNATVPVAYEARLSKFFVNEEVIDEQFDKLASDLTDEQKNALAKKYGKKEALVKLESRMRAVAQDIVEHYKLYVEPNGFKAQVVCYDRETTAQYKALFDKLVPPEWSEVVYSPGDVNMDSEELAKYVTTKRERERIIRDFKNPSHPLRFLLVCDMLLTGFDAPIEQVMYLDKSLRDHNLLQAIARTNRVYPKKAYGKVIDYYGITRNLYEALDFDEEIVDQALLNIDELKKEFTSMMDETLALFPDIDRTNPSRETLQKCLQPFVENEELQEQFRMLYRRLNILFETLSPDPFLHEYIPKFEWLTKVYFAFLNKYQSDHDIHTALSEYGGKVQTLIRDNIDYEGITKNYRDISIYDLYFFEHLKGMDDDDKALNLERILKREISLNEMAHPLYQKFSERFSRIKEEFERRQMDLAERIKQYTELAEEIRTANKEAQELDFDLREHGVYQHVRDYAKGDEQERQRFVREISQWFIETLDEKWQDSSKREEFIKDIKRKVQEIVLRDYKDVLKVEDFHGLMNRLVDVAIKRY